MHSLRPHSVSRWQNGFIENYEIYNNAMNCAYRDYSVVTVYESDSDLFTRDKLKTVCEMDNSVVRATPGFYTWCSCYVNSQCAPSLSLGTYIASIRNRSSCQDITEADVAFAKNLLKTCADAYFNEKLDDQSSPQECRLNNTFVQNVFDLLVDVDFIDKTDILKATMVLSPAIYDPDFARDIYDQHLSGDLPERNGVKLVAFTFDNFKFDQFNLQLLLDAVFPVIGLVMVALILMLYTHSVVIMALTIFSVVTSVIIAYFIYHQVFRLTFFPFLNILTFVFLVGIGADDAFVFNDVWSQAKLAQPRGSIIDWTEYTFRHAAMAMFVTSFTTSAAFYANVLSNITAVRLFGIYSGTSILIKYSLMITWFPSGVIFMEKRRHSRNSKVEILELQGNPAIEENPETKDTRVDGEFPTGSRRGSEDALEKPDNTGFSSNTQSLPQRSPLRYYRIARSKCADFMRDLFEKWIPISLRGYPIWLIAFLALGIGMIVAVLVSPGLRRPTSSDFQVFSSSHILEQYDLKYKNEFRLERTGDSNMNVFVYFGFKATDNGNYLEPDNFGELEYDSSFDVLRPDAQKWFLEDLCPSIRSQAFFGRNVSWSCFPEVICLIHHVTTIN